MHSLPSRHLLVGKNIHFWDMFHTEYFVSCYALRTSLIDPCKHYKNNKLDCVLICVTFSNTNHSLRKDQLNQHLFVHKLNATFMKEAHPAFARTPDVPELFFPLCNLLTCFHSFHQSQFIYQTMSSLLDCKCSSASLWTVYQQTVLNLCLFLSFVLFRPSDFTSSYPCLVFHLHLGPLPCCSPIQNEY